VVGAVVGVILLLSICTICLRRKSRRRCTRPAALGASDTEADSPLPKSKGTIKLFRKLFVDSLVTTQME
jgi:hypothetical protein